MIAGAYGVCAGCGAAHDGGPGGYTRDGRPLCGDCYRRTRQEHALTHPLNVPADLAPYRSVDACPDGNLLVTVLAVDR